MHLTPERMRAHGDAGGFAFGMNLETLMNKTGLRCYPLCGERGIGQASADRHDFPGHALAAAHRMKGLQSCRVWEAGDGRTSCMVRPCRERLSGRKGPELEGLHGRQTQKKALEPKEGSA